jgi:initiation factor 1A
MPKNTTGGNKSKKQANKYATPAPIVQKVRTTKDEDEVYGIVLKLFGGNLFECYCIDKEKRLGHIPGKMRSSRNKKDNLVQPGVWVMVGHLGTKTNKGQEEVQLLEVYTSAEVEKLKKTVAQNWGILLSQDSSNKTSSTTSNTNKDNKEDDGIEFSNELPEPVFTKNTPVIQAKCFQTEEDVINIDDI